MGCKELNITDYFRLTPTTGNLETPIPGSTSSRKTANSRFKPVVSVSILNYRYYSPELGRWLSREPLGEKGSFNLYTFVSNRPVTYLDYLGLVSYQVPPTEDDFTTSPEGDIALDEAGLILGLKDGEEAVALADVEMIPNAEIETACVCLPTRFGKCDSEWWICGAWYKSYSVTAVWHKKTSYRRQGKKLTRKTLRHEWQHLKIAHIFAARMQEAIRNLGGRGEAGERSWAEFLAKDDLKAQTDSIKKVIDTDYRKLQKSLDKHKKWGRHNNRDKEALDFWDSFLDDLNQTPTSWEKLQKKLK